MTEPRIWHEVPSTWTAVPSTELDELVQRTLALFERPSPAGRHRLAEAISGATSLPLLLAVPSPRAEVTAADLLAASLAGAAITAAVADRVLGDGPHAREISVALRALPTDGLSLVGTNGLRAMDALHLAITLAVGASNSDAAVDICARKRPDLFPRLGGAARELLGLPPAEGYRTDWLLLRDLVGRSSVVRGVAVLITDVGGGRAPAWARAAPGGGRLLDLCMVIEALAGA